MRGEAFVLFVVIAVLIGFMAMVAFDASDCHDHGGELVRTLGGGYSCVRVLP